MSLAKVAGHARSLPNRLVDKSEIEVLGNSAVLLKNDLNSIIALLKQSPPHDFFENTVLLSVLHLLKLVLRAAYQIGGYLHVTGTVDRLVKKEMRALDQRNATKAAQAKRSPAKRVQRGLVSKIFRSARKIRPAAHVCREISKEGLKTTAKTVRNDLIDLRSSPPEKAPSKGRLVNNSHRPLDGALLTVSARCNDRAVSFTSRPFGEGRHGPSET